VIPGSAAAAAGIRTGDLVSRINGETVAAWDPARYDQLVASATSIDYTFIDGARESVRTLGVTDLVP
jgi:membrane-associated protease RseP (regulator of RpoE activity)